MSTVRAEGSGAEYSLSTSGRPPSPAPPSLMEEGRQEGCFTGSSSGLWKAWQGSSRKPGNLEGNSHSRPRPGDPPPGGPLTLPQGCYPPSPCLGLHTASGLPHGVQACPRGTWASRKESPSSPEAPASKWGATWCVEGPTWNEGPWGHCTWHRGLQPPFTPPAHQRGASVGSTHTRTRLLRWRSRKRGKSVHPRGRSERLLTRAGPDDSVVSAPSARSQQGPRQLVASAVPAPETHRPPGGSAKWL